MANLNFFRRNHFVLISNISVYRDSKYNVWNNIMYEFLRQRYEKVFVIKINYNLFHLNDRYNVSV